MLLMLAIFFSGAAFSQSTSDLSNGYSGCKWRDNGNGTTTLSLTIHYKEALGHVGRWDFLTRGIAIYTYDKNGKLKPSTDAASAVYMNEYRHLRAWYNNAYVMYYGPTQGVKSPWSIADPFSANVNILLNNNYVSDWPAVSVRAGNFTNGDDFVEITGGAYITPYGDGVCQVVDPERPPPPSIGINIAVPDWNLGELPRGDGEKIFANSAEQLCFTYVGALVSGRTFVVNASNANGVVNNRYLLKNLTDVSQTVPYSVTLNSSTGAMTLPNSGNISASFSTTGKTCFVPTFKTSVSNLVKEGNYSDVLTFTVVTKS
ncbi:hypothetical protein [Burkholderia pyrrocinia]|uniref:hypothetical protein n=1 Tax=Burkholderia pyrrocinia TaxID=60550 RepID=UPI0030CAD530